MGKEQIVLFFRLVCVGHGPTLGTGTETDIAAVGGLTIATTTVRSDTTGTVIERGTERGRGRRRGRGTG